MSNGRIGMARAAGAHACAAQPKGLCRFSELA
jgi:hypothetical protein